MPDSLLLTPTFIKTLATLPVQGRQDIRVSESPYFLPNIPSECERLNLQHLILHQFFKRQFFVPLGQARQAAVPGTGSWNDQIVERVQQRDAPNNAAAPKRILDVGCGTGQWALAIAQQFPTAQVVGLDIVTPARPFPLPLPPNFTFTEANILRGLGAFADGAFDFVHMRCLGLGIPGTRWQMVINELARVTMPGGWVESVEIGLPHEGGPAFATVHTMIEHILAARGLDLTSLQRIDAYLRQATPAMHTISSYAVDIPIGAAGGAHGARMSWNVLLQLNNLASFFLQARCWDAATWQDLRQQVEAELSQAEYQPGVTVSIAMGQRR